MKTIAFSQIEFQDRLTATLCRLWAQKSRTGKLHCGKAVRQLRRQGYTMDQAYAIVDDARDMAALLMECQ